MQRCSYAFAPAHVRAILSPSTWCRLSLYLPSLSNFQWCARLAWAAAWSSCPADNGAHLWHGEIYLWSEASQKYSEDATCASPPNANVTSPPQPLWLFIAKWFTACYLWDSCDGTRSQAIQIPGEVIKTKNKRGRILVAVYHFPTWLLLLCPCAKNRTQVLWGSKSALNVLKHWKHKAMQTDMYI